ncbi:PQQ-binding-like beta-propeller repeat protein [Streptomyces sp. NPDC053794]
MPPPPPMPPGPPPAQPVQAPPAYPAYGQPQQQPQPYPGQGGGWGTPPPQPPKSNTGKIVGIILACVVVLGVLGAGGIFVLNKATMHQSGSSTDDKLPSNALQLAWDTDLAKTDTTDSGSDNGLPNFQLVKDNLIVGDKTGVRAYDPSDGTVKWELAAPKGAGEPCAMSRHGSDRGLLAVIFDAGGDDCSIVSVVDVDSGKITWSQKMSGKYNTFASQAEIAINDHTLTTNVGGTSTISNWKSQGGKGYPLYARARYCDDGVIFGSSYVVGHSFCDNVSPHNALTVTDTAYGGEKTYSDPQKLEVSRILAESPLTVLLQDKNEKQYVQSFPDDKPGKVFPLTGDLAELQIDEERHTTVVDDSVLVTGYKHAEGLAGVDLKTGKLLWKKTESYQLVGYDGSAKKLYVAQDDPENPFDQRLLAVDPRTGRQKVAGAMALKGTSGIGIVAGTQYAYDGSTVYLLGEKSVGTGRVVRAFKLPTG